MILSSLKAVYHPKGHDTHTDIFYSLIQTARLYFYIRIRLSIMESSSHLFIYLYSA